MRVIIDVMGGDNAPGEVLKGVLSAAENTGAAFTLVGEQDVLADFKERFKPDPERFALASSGPSVTMEDDPLAAVRLKKDSSMMTSLRLLKEGAGDAVVSAGNTGALFAGATLIAGRAPGIRRAAIGTVLPGKEKCLLLDAGANVTATPEYLEQFALIGASYMSRMYGTKNPRIGLLNNGTEAHKGTDLQIETAKRLRENAGVNFIGNVEASAVLEGVCDCVVCDGFTGNIYLKTLEGTGKRILSLLKDIYTESFLTKLSFLLIRRRIKRLKNMFDPSEHGGSPILGIAGTVIKAHGSSDARAFEHAVYQALRCADGASDDKEKK